MQKVAGFIGKFYPPHIGHLSVIDSIIQKFDEVYVIISYNRKRNEQINQSTKFKVISPEQIKEWFEVYYKDNPKVIVKIFDESDLRPYPYDQDIWAEKFKNEFKKINVKVADESYREFNKQYFADYEFYPVMRDIIPVHSTMIRSKCLDGNVEEIKQFVTKETYEYLLKEYKK